MANLHCHVPTSLTVAVTSESCSTNVPEDTSNKCSSAFSSAKISVASGAEAAFGAVVGGIGAFSFREERVFLVVRSGETTFWGFCATMGGEAGGMAASLDTVSAAQKYAPREG